MSCIYCGSKTFIADDIEVCSSCGYIHRHEEQDTKEEEKNGK
jgi:ribosomal protein L37E